MPPPGAVTELQAGNSPKIPYSLHRPNDSNYPNALNLYVQIEPDFTARLMGRYQLIEDRRANYELPTGPGYGALLFFEDYELLPNTRFIRIHYQTLNDLNKDKYKSFAEITDQNNNGVYGDNNKYRFINDNIIEE